MFALWVLAVCVGSSLIASGRRHSGFLSFPLGRRGGRFFSRRGEEETGVLVGDRGRRPSRNSTVLWKMADVFRESFSMEGKRVEFGCSKGFSIDMGESSDAQVDAYFSDPGRFLRSMWTHEIVSKPGGEQFELGFPSVMLLKWEIPSPRVEVRLHRPNSTCLEMRSTGFRFPGKSLLKEFELQVNGTILAVEKGVDRKETSAAERQDDAAESERERPKHVVFESGLGFNVGATLPSLIALATSETILRYSAKLTSKQILKYATAKFERDVASDFRNFRQG
mmetsp:Transcript_16224/g.32868  ORF Transcript_16224/g.32868 Transcript_16224/m.32868 type:complete len:280 (+) Transcript_16224:184-1023(+)